MHSDCSQPQLSTSSDYAYHEKPKALNHNANKLPIGEYPLGDQPLSQSVGYSNFEPSCPSTVHTDITLGVLIPASQRDTTASAPPEQSNIKEEEPPSYFDAINMSHSNSRM